MKKKLTFLEMQTFINSVVELTLKYGFGYKDIIIDYYYRKFYKEVEFTTDDIMELYDNGEISEFDYNMLDYDNPAHKQINTIISAINQNIDKEIKLICAERVMGKANEAVAELANDIDELIKKQDKQLGADEIKSVINAIVQIKDNVNAENLTKAMLDNGIIKPIVVEDKKDGE